MGTRFFKKLPGNSLGIHKQDPQNPQNCKSSISPRYLLKMAIEKRNNPPQRPRGATPTNASPTNQGRPLSLIKHPQLSSIWDLHRSQGFWDFWWKPPWRWRQIEYLISGPRLSEFSLLIMACATLDITMERIIVFTIFITERESQVLTNKLNQKEVWKLWDLAKETWTVTGAQILGEQDGLRGDDILRYLGWLWQVKHYFFIFLPNATSEHARLAMGNQLR